MKRRSFLRKIALAPVIAAVATDLIFSQPDKSWFENQLRIETEKMRSQLNALATDFIFYGRAQYKFSKEGGIERIHPSRHFDPSTMKEYQIP